MIKNEIMNCRNCEGTEPSLHIFDSDKCSVICLKSGIAYCSAYNNGKRLNTGHAAIFLSTYMGRILDDFDSEAGTNDK